jgi:hypothetical protein
MSDREPNLQYKLVARYSDTAHARDAVTSLERAGVDAGRITLVDSGPSGVPTNDAQLQTDLNATRHVGKRVGKGAAIGAAVGAVIGVIAGVIVANMVGVPAVTGAIVGGLLGGLGLAMPIGGFIGGAATLPVDNESFAKTFEPNCDRPVTVSVAADDPDELDSLQERLADTGASGIERIDAGVRREV